MNVDKEMIQELARLNKINADLLAALEAILSIEPNQYGDILLPTKADPSYLESQDAAMFEPFNKARDAIKAAKGE